jgi:hypothetical protein
MKSPGIIGRFLMAFLTVSFLSIPKDCREYLISPEYSNVEQADFSLSGKIPYPILPEDARPATTEQLNNFLKNDDDILQSYREDEWYPWRCSVWAEKVAERMRKHGIDAYIVSGVYRIDNFSGIKTADIPHEYVVFKLMDENGNIEEFIADYSANQITPQPDFDPEYTPLETRKEFFKTNDIVPVIGPREELLGVYPNLACEGKNMSIYCPK